MEKPECHHCHLMCCVYIKGLVNTKDQSNACMCEMMSKGSKEALTVLIDTHVTHVKRVERLHYVHYWYGWKSLSLSFLKLFLD